MAALILYSNQALLCALTLRAYFPLPFRSTQEFILSIFRLLKVDLPVPSYTRLCRRAKDDQIPQLSKKRPTDLVFDSTGLKVYGEGEWKVKVQGKSKRRTWRKFHRGVDPQSHETLLIELTSNTTSDSEILSKQFLKATLAHLKKCTRMGLMMPQNAVKL